MNFIVLLLFIIVSSGVKVFRVVCLMRPLVLVKVIRSGRLIILVWLKLRVKLALRILRRLKVLVMLKLKCRIMCRMSSELVWLSSLEQTPGRGVRGRYT